MEINNILSTLQPSDENRCPKLRGIELPKNRKSFGKLLDKPCTAGCEASESQKRWLLQGKTTFFTNFQKKCSKSGSRKLDILPPNAIKEGFSKNPLFKLCVLSSTYAHVFSAPTKLPENPDRQTNKQTNIQSNFLAQTTRVLRTINSTKDLRIKPPPLKDQNRFGPRGVFIFKFFDFQKS